MTTFDPQAHFDRLESELLNSLDKEQLYQLIQCFVAYCAANASFVSGAARHLNEIAVGDDSVTELNDEEERQGFMELLRRMRQHLSETRDDMVDIITVLAQLERIIERQDIG